MYSERKWRLKDVGGKKCDLIYKDYKLFFHVSNYIFKIYFKN